MESKLPPQTTPVKPSQIYRRRPRRFAPLNKDRKATSDVQTLKGIVFDVDGTLCKPQTYMFQEMRDILGIPKSRDILDHITSLPTLTEQDQTMNSIRAIESKAMETQEPQEGLQELMEYLEERGLRKGLCTRNFNVPVEHLLTTFLPTKTFHPIITRDFKPPKPHPAGILKIAEEWGLDDEGRSLIMVGDSMDDMTAGRRAGAATVLLLNDVNQTAAEHDDTDVCINRLDDLVKLLEGGFDSEDGGGGAR